MSTDDPMQTFNGLSSDGLAVTWYWGLIEGYTEVLELGFHSRGNKLLSADYDSPGVVECSVYRHKQALLDEQSTS